MPSLKIALGNYGLTKPLKDGGVAVGGRELEYVPMDAIVPAMRRMVRGLEFDICEMAFTTYLCAKAYGKPLTAIPVFVTRNFHHWAILYNVNSGIKKPKDLEGRTVGVNRGYTVTTGLWARGILQSEYGVDLRKITWAPSDDEHVAEYKYPANVDLSYRGRPLAELLVSGKLPAAVGDVRVSSPDAQNDVQPLIPDARNAGFGYFRKTGVYPINHGLVIKDSVLKANPGLGKELFDAFRAAKKIYIAHLDAGENLSPADDTALALRQVVGDPFPFGITDRQTPNRKALETMMQFAVDQQVISTKFSVEELFATETLDLE